MPTTAIDLDLLSTFLAVADEASFSRAARRLGVTKGTVSRAIARLEARLGAELVHRTTHKVALSTAGTALYERTAPHLVALDQAVRKLPERAEQPSGQLRITVLYDFGVMILPGVIAQFSLRYPEVSFDVRVTNRRVDLVAEGFDLAIRASPVKLADSSLSVRRLGTAELRYYASPAYVARRGEPRSAEDPGHEWVAFAPFERHAGRAKRPQPRFHSDDLLFIRELLQGGAGVGPLPAFMAEPYVRAGTLVAVAPSLRSRGPGGYYLLYPSSGQVPRKVTAFHDFLVETLRVRPIDPA
jgi:DNA-binding transcriptional LysR family regulator